MVKFPAFKIIDVPNLSTVAVHLGRIWREYGTAAYKVNVRFSKIRVPSLEVVRSPLSPTHTRYRGLSELMGTMFFAWSGCFSFGALFCQKYSMRVANWIISSVSAHFYAHTSHTFVDAQTMLTARMCLEFQPNLSSIRTSMFPKRCIERCCFCSFISSLTNNNRLLHDY